LTAYSHPQRSVSLSSTQAEYQALASAAQEIMFFRHLLKELGFESTVATPLLCDNQGALYLAVSTKNHPKVKHISIKFHYIRQLIKSQDVNLLYVQTKEQIADIFTKPLSFTLFVKFRRSLGLHAWGGDRLK
jgi:hypothetical protein